MQWCLVWQLVIGEADTKILPGSTFWEYTVKNITKSPLYQQATKVWGNIFHLRQPSSCNFLVCDRMLRGDWSKRDSIGCQHSLVACIYIHRGCIWHIDRHPPRDIYVYITHTQTTNMYIWLYIYIHIHIHIYINTWRNSLHLNLPCVYSYTHFIYPYLYIYTYIDIAYTHTTYYR